MTIINTVGGPAPKPIRVEAVEDTPASLPHTYQPGEGFDYLSSVTVGADPNLTAGNIKQGVSIFGVEGTLASGGGIGPDTFVSNATWLIPNAYLVGGQTMWNEGTPVTAEELPDVKYYGYQCNFKCAVDNRYVLCSYGGFTTSRWGSQELRKYVYKAQHLELRSTSVTAENPRFFSSVPESDLFGGRVIGAGDTIKLWMKFNMESQAAFGTDPNDITVIGTLSFNSSSIDDAVLTVDVPETTVYARSDVTSLEIAMKLVAYYGELIS